MKTNSKWIFILGAVIIFQVGFYSVGMIGIGMELAKEKHEKSCQVMEALK